jgi:deoxyribonuclease-2
MGICFSFIPKLNKKQDISVILKIPHKKECFEIGENSSLWKHHIDVNIILKSKFSEKYDHWLVYNDETPTATSSHFAHAKGILAWNSEKIIWLIHSVPKFPIEFNGTNQFPDISHAELEYGQSFCCVTIDISHLENILKQVFIMNPNVYISNIDYKKYKDFHTCIDKNIYKINDKLQHVAKSPEFHRELYEDILIPGFGGNCFTETWVRGHHCIDSGNCKMAEMVKFKDGISYKYTQDHSKYCYSDKGWVMVGDLNRMTSQIKRGGGGIVIHQNNICDGFSQILKKGT